MCALAILLYLLQEPSDQPAPSPGERKVVVIGSPLKPQDVGDVPYSIGVVTREDLERRLTRTTPDALKEMPGVSVQKTAHGHGSPFIRGFTGFRTVFLIDGIRLNHAAFRDGPNQYWNTVDPFLIERLEVVKGPASVLYGSDAIGGTVYAHMRTPEKFPEAFELRSRGFYRYSSAEDSHVGREEVTAASPSGAIIAGATWRDFGDLVGGRHVGQMPDTGYEEIDADGKVIMNFGGGRTLTFATQGSRQNNVPRTHRTVSARPWHGTVAGTDQKHEFDQERDLIYAQFRWKEMASIVDEMHVSVSYHRQQEELNRLTSSLTKEFRGFEVRSGGFFANFLKDTPAGLFTFGTDFYVDVVQSDGFNRTSAGAVTEFDRGEVADESVVDLAGVFVQDEIPIGSRADLTLGARATWSRIHAEEVDPSGFGAPPLSEFEETFSAVVGSARLLYRADENVRLIAGVSQGFRAPNLDDTTSVRLVMSGQTDFPNADLDPERSVNFEIGARLEYESFGAAVFGFYTLLDDFIARRPEPSLGPGAFVKDNFSDGYVYGVEAYGEYRLCTTWVFWGDFTWSIGNLDALVGGVEKEEPISKMNPAMAHVGIRYAPRGATYFLEGVLTAARRQDRLSPTDVTDTQRIPPGGTPGYTVATLRGGLELFTNIRATVAVENVTDKDYRAHGSGVNEPGTNFVLGLDVRF